MVKNGYTRFKSRLTLYVPVANALQSGLAASFGKATHRRFTAEYWLTNNVYMCSCRSGYRARLEILWALPAQVRILLSTFSSTSFTHTNIFQGGVILLFFDEIQKKKPKRA